MKETHVLKHLRPWPPGRDKQLDLPFATFQIRRRVSRGKGITAAIPGMLPEFKAQVSCKGRMDPGISGMAGMSQSHEWRKFSGLG
jgi:hypothetical protein